MERDRYVITFKNNDKEQKIKEFLASKVNATAYLKELCWDIMNNRTVNNTVINDTDNENITIEDKEEQQVKKKKVGGLKNPNK